MIDAWMQQPNAEFLAQPWLASLQRWTAKDEGFRVPALAETVAAMDAAGVELGLLAAWHGPNGRLISNEEVAVCIDAYPDRFLGVASVDLQRPMEAVRQLRHCVTKLGFKGLRVVPWLWGLPPDDRRYYPLFAECVELGVPFCTQIGHTGPLLSSEPGRPIPYLEHVALEFPELTIVGGHVGAPWTQEVISLAHKFPNVYLDTSAYKLKRLPPDFVRFLRDGGARKVLFGSNYPMLTPAECLEGFDELQLSEADAALMLHDNAARVFGVSPQH